MSKSSAINGAFPSVQCYPETDLRHQCLQNAMKPQRSERFRRASIGVLSGRHLQRHSWAQPDERRPSSSSRLEHPVKAGLLRFGSSPPSQIKTGSKADSTIKADPSVLYTKRGGKYDDLSTAQKVGIIVKDEIQWPKLQRSLRDAGGLWTSIGVQQVLDSHVQQRIEEMERLEVAMSEQYGPCSTPDMDKKMDGKPTVVDAVKKIARRASFATQSLVQPSVRNPNNSPQTVAQERGSLPTIYSSSVSWFHRNKKTKDDIGPLRSRDDQ